MRDASLSRAEPIDLAALQPRLIAAVSRYDIHRVVISGGEPTLVPNLDLLISVLEDHAVASLCTNATLVSTALAQRLARAGLRRATVGLEGAGSVYDEFRRSPGGFRRASAGIQALADAGIRVTLNVTMHNQLLDGVEPFAVAARNMPIAAISVTSPMSQGRLCRLSDAFSMVTEPRVRQFAMSLVRLVSVPISVRIPRCNLASCPSGERIFAMDASGNISGCPDEGACNVADRILFSAEADAAVLPC
jgi:MoaA/NifB/PqqE/SkfB family radical SAM enzyme